MQKLKTLWEFSRPHTIIGSLVSITALFLISTAITYPREALPQASNHIYIYLITLLSALSCNMFITGLNQLQDVEIDKINKPWLPIPSGKLSMSAARIIIYTSLVISIAASLLVNHILFILILTILAVGTAYSLPPLKFKKHHIAAAVSIVLVRGLLVNVGMPVQFIYAFTKQMIIPVDVWPLTFFVIGFSLAIAWFKDIPDTGGDEAFNIKTLAISITPAAAFRYGVAAVAISYIGLLALSFYLNTLVNHIFFFTAHALLLMLFLIGSSRVRLNEGANMKKSYLLFWGFFFAEYIVYTLAYFL
jgi:homogentisate phytyltransferase/homogentisate geranylgeranyltransferase